MLLAPTYVNGYNTLDDTIVTQTHKLIGELMSSPVTGSDPEDLELSIHIDLTATDLDGIPEIDDLAVIQTHVLLVSSLESDNEIDTAAITNTHYLPVSAMDGSNDIDTVAIEQTHDLG